MYMYSSGIYLSLLSSQHTVEVALRICACTYFYEKFYCICCVDFNSYFVVCVVVPTVRQAQEGQET